MGNLTALKVKNAKPGERLSDGDGLRLDVDKNGNASWIFRFKSPQGPVASQSSHRIRYSADRH